MLITTLIVSFCKDGRGSVNVKLCFLVVYVRCEVLCRSFVLDKVYPKHVELITNTIKQVASSWFLFFGYHNDARSNKHQNHTSK